MPTATDQEIIVYAGHQLKSIGDVSNLQPTTMLIANADRLTEIECHSSNLINTDLSECKLLQRELDGESKESIEKDYEDVNELIKSDILITDLAKVNNVNAGFDVYINPE